MKKNLLEYLEISAEKFPDKVAFTDNNNQISFSDLLVKSKALGTYLSRSLGRKNRLPVVVVVQRQISTIIAFLGVLYSGNFYVPVDPKIPINRKNVILNSVKPAAVIYASNDETFFDDTDFKTRQFILEMGLDEPVNHSLLQSNRQKMVDTDPLFAIFTSGSTGIPKCVLITHQSVIKFVENFSILFELNSDVILGNQAPFDYDGSVKEISLTLKNGSTMHIIPKMLFSFPLKLFDYLDELKINTLNWATSALRIIAAHNALDIKKPSFIQKIFFSGEVMPNKVLNHFRRNLPDVFFVNLYGPTEITFNCSFYVVNRQFSDEEDLPIGIPFPNTDITILNDNDMPVAMDEIGEICVRGSSIALGYYNNQGATKKSFVQNPLNNNFPEIIYRTGDLGKYNDLGELMFVSRKDHQIKHMGYRIELGEIEAAVNSLPFIDHGLSIYDNIRKSIVLFYQSSEACDRKILRELREKLPKHMIPTVLIYQKELPLRENLKIDRLKLQQDYFNEIDK